MMCFDVPFWIWLLQINCAKTSNVCLQGPPPILPAKTATKKSSKHNFGQSASQRNPTALLLPPSCSIPRTHRTGTTSTALHLVLCPSSAACSCSVVAVQYSASRLPIFSRLFPIWLFIGVGLLVMRHSCALVCSVLPESDRLLGVLEDFAFEAWLGSDR